LNRIVYVLKRFIFALAVLVILFSAITSGSGQAPYPISLSFASSALPLIIGQTPTITVTVTNIINSSVQLTFLGLRWEWNTPPGWFIGGNSEKGVLLAAGQQVTYSIAAAIPNNVTVGTHKLIAYVTYRWFMNGNWTGLIAGFWVTDFSFASSQAPTGMGGISQTSNLETIIVLVLVVAIALFMERGHIRRLTRKFQKTSPEQSTQAKTESEKAAQKSGGRKSTVPRNEPENSISR